MLKMAFNNFLAPVWLAPGQTHFWAYSFGGNRGAQYAMADVKTPNAILRSTEQGKRLEPDGAATYFVTIRNDGPMWAYYNLQGGGLG
jgi:hypothetical protein